MAQRKPGLWHGPRRVEITDVKKAHRTPCVACGDMPKFRRMEITEGSGRSAKKFILCALHAAEWIDARRAESSRALSYLFMENDGPIRKDGPDPSWWPKAKKKEKPLPEVDIAITCVQTPQKTMGAAIKSLQSVRRRTAP
jgi:hypothetical protein